MTTTSRPQGASASERITETDADVYEVIDLMRLNYRRVVGSDEAVAG